MTINNNRILLILLIHPISIKVPLYALHHGYLLNRGPTPIYIVEFLIL